MRTAAIVGTAAVVSGSVQHHQQEKYAAQDAAAQPEVQYVEAPPAAPDMNAELTQLGG